MHSAAAALQAVVLDPSPEMREYCSSTAQGLLLQALAPLLRAGAGGLPPAAARLLQASEAAWAAALGGMSCSAGSRASLLQLDAGSRRFCQWGISLQGHIRRLF